MALIGESGSLTFFQGILMVSVSFAGLITFILTLGTSPCPVDVSAGLPMPSIMYMTRFMSPVPK